MIAQTLERPRPRYARRLNSPNGPCSGATHAMAAYQASKIYRLERRDDWVLALCGGVPVARCRPEAAEELLRNLIAAEGAAMCDPNFDRGMVRWSDLRGKTVRQRIARALECVS